MNSLDFFEKIQAQLQEKLPFVAYRHPNETEVLAQLQENSTLEFLEDFTQKGFIFAPFDSSKKTVFFDSASAEIISTASSAIEVEENTETKSFQSTLQEKTFHEKLVSKGIQKIKTSTLKKVVLSRAEQIITATNSINYFKRLLKKYPTAFVYVWYHPSVGLWLGATPETLLKTEQNSFKTMALAGTKAFEGNLDVEWGAKEKEEQALVTESIQADLESVNGIEKLIIGETQTHQAGNVLHLKTPISGIFQQEFLGEIVQKLHPTPAVCGLPKEEAKNFIKAEENYDRSFYTGYLGELNRKVEKTRNPRRKNVENSAYNLVQNQTNLYVNLRCMQVLEKKVIVYVGGGITASSNPTAEWEETVKKAETMQKVL
ncbi:chorismate-binding protein [Mesonia maritima]|uniref:Isochorismate synthase n=1 Tax=Mesonia maritima TaxID=1793873 RepID=A0ABU1K723_9FLAO|nr:chorismate-binding protein [Mesonia maritima]MDR6301413.1 isochorismate synthase [Mesonia maritima]